MKTGTVRHRVVGGLGAALLAVSACSFFGARAASAAANQPGKTEPQGQTPPPHILIRQNDLAADSLLPVPGASISGQRNCLSTVLVATCKNLGAQTYKPGYRAMRIYHTVAGVNYVVAASFIPQLAPGKTFWITYQLPFNEEVDEEDEGYWMEVSQGSSADECPANDTYAEDDPILGYHDKVSIQIGERP